MATERILSPKAIPKSLWDSEKETLFMPRRLADAYISLIESKGLRDLAAARNASSSPVGGLTQEATDEHLAQSFDGSVARALLAVLDPKSEVSSTSNSFLRATAGNSACITDAPCGAGAATLAFLCALAELREANVLPRLPLKVAIVGGEISQPAAAYARHLIDAIKPALLAQAISVEHTIIPWDVTCPISTTDLITCAVQNSQGSSGKLLVVANFSGFLESHGNRAEAMPQLQELFRYASGENSFAVWIEPRMKKVLNENGLFRSFFKPFSKIWKKYVSKDAGSLDDQSVFTSEASFERPLFSQTTAAVRLAVMPIDLQRSRS